MGIPLFSKHLGANYCSFKGRGDGSVISLFFLCACDSAAWPLPLLGRDCGCLGLSNYLCRDWLLRFDGSGSGIVLLLLVPVASGPESSVWLLGVLISLCETPQVCCVSVPGAFLPLERITINLYWELLARLWARVGFFSSRNPPYLGRLLSVSFYQEGVERSASQPVSEVRSCTSVSTAKKQGWTLLKPRKWASARLTVKPLVEVQRKLLASC